MCWVSVNISWLLVNTFHYTLMDSVLLYWKCLFFSSCVSQTLHCCDKIPNINNLWVKRFFYCCTGVHCDIYKSSYNIIIVEFTLSIILLYPLSPISGIVSTDPISPFLYMNTQYFHTVHPPTPFPYIFLRSTGTNPLLQTGPVLPFCSHFWKKKKTFLFV
jgi:hypothetical protein